jgi:hypothetical protein
MMSEKLGALQLEMRVNVTDRHLLTNLNYCKELNLPKLRFAEANDRTLAIIGSGPSLEQTYQHIPPNCDIMALNGAYKFLRSKHFIPRYFAMLDARPVNVNFLDDLQEDTTYLLASQCAPECFDRLVGHHRGIFHLSTPTTKQVFPDEELYIGGGGTIGLTAIGIATALGYRHVILYGFDSSYAGERRHVEYQAQNDKENSLEVWVDDRKYVTSHAMAAQVMDFFPYHDILQKTFPGYVVDLVGNGLFYDFVVTNNNPSTRERELSKYAEAYQMEDYGMTEERKDGIEDLISELPPGLVSYLDVSTGRGETLDLADKYGFACIRGTETVDALLNSRTEYAILPHLPFQDKCFDVVSLFEVIEHLVAEDVVPALVELTRVARKHILISAAVQQCWIGGVNLHPSSRPVEQWEELFRSIWGNHVRRMGNLGGSPVWRVDL